MGNTNDKRKKPSKNEEYGETFEKKPLTSKKVQIEFSDVTEKYGYSYTEEKVTKKMIPLLEEEKRFLIPNQLAYIGVCTIVVFNVDQSICSYGKIVLYKRNDIVDMIFPFAIMNEFIENEELKI